MIALLVIVSALFFFDKNIFLTKSKGNLIFDWKNKRYIPLFIVLIMLIGTVSITIYFNYNIDTDKAKYDKLISEFNIGYDTLTNSNKDSLAIKIREIEAQLSELNFEIKKREKIIGEQKRRIDFDLKKLYQALKNIETYNEVLENDSFSKFQMGYNFRESNDLAVYCPNDTSEYLDFALWINNKNLFQRIAYIQLDFQKTKSKGAFYELDFERYKPKMGLNAFRVKNHLRSKGTRLVIGYVFKSDIYKEYPTVFGVECKGHR